MTCWHKGGDILSAFDLFAHERGADTRQMLRCGDEERLHPRAFAVKFSHGKLIGRVFFIADTADEMGCPHLFCVIGGVSFVGGTGKISGIVVGVLLLQIIFVGLNFLSVDQNMLYIIKGSIILLACAADMRKHLARR